MTKPKLSKKDILHVAKLSNLKLTDYEIKKFTPQLAKIIDFVSQLSEVDTSGVDPTVSTTGLTNVFRKDTVKVENVLPVEDALSGTENHLNNLFKVTKILTK